MQIFTLWYWFLLHINATLIFFCVCARLFEFASSHTSHIADIEKQKTNTHKSIFIIWFKFGQWMLSHDQWLGLVFDFVLVDLCILKWKWLWMDEYVLVFDCCNRFKIMESSWSWMTACWCWPAWFVCSRCFCISLDQTLASIANACLSISCCGLIMPTTIYPFLTWSNIMPVCATKNVESFRFLC